MNKSFTGNIVDLPTPASHIQFCDSVILSAVGSVLNPAVIVMHVQWRAQNLFRINDLRCDKLIINLHLALLTNWLCKLATNKSIKIHAINQPIPTNLPASINQSIKRNYTKAQSYRVSANVFRSWLGGIDGRNALLDHRVAMLDGGYDFSPSSVDSGWYGLTAAGAAVECISQGRTGIRFIMYIFNV